MAQAPAVGLGKKKQQQEIFFHFFPIFQPPIVEPAAKWKVT
jgi:hypothetical protein